MQIKNPTKDTIEVNIKGVPYMIEPEGTLDNVPEEAARYWQENLHKFLVLRKDKLETPAVEEIEIPTPTVETVEIPSDVVITRDEAIEQGIDVEKVEAEAETIEDTEAVIVEKESEDTIEDAPIVKEKATTKKKK